MSLIDPARALIFRITHISNVPWLLEHGLRCWNAPEFDPNFRNIGSADLISRRHHRPSRPRPKKCSCKPNSKRRNLSVEIVVRPNWYF